MKMVKPKAGEKSLIFTHQGVLTNLEQKKKKIEKKARNW